MYRFNHKHVSNYHKTVTDDILAGLMSMAAAAACPEFYIPLQEVLSIKFIYLNALSLMRRKSTHGGDVSSG